MPPRRRYKIFKFASFSLFFPFSFRLNNHLHRGKKKNGNIETNIKIITLTVITNRIEEHKYQDGLFAKCFCYNRRSWKKKRQLESGMLGALPLSVPQLSNKGRRDCSVLSPAQTFHTWKRLEITVWSYGMYPKSVWMTKNWDCLFFHTSTHLPSPPTRVHPPAEDRVISDQRPVGSKDVLLKVRRGPAMGEENAFPNPSPPSRRVRLPNKLGISGGFLPSSSGSILNGETVWSRPLYMRGNCSCFYLFETTETNIVMNKCKDKK